MISVLMVLTNGFRPDVRVYKEAKHLVEKGCNVTVLCWDRDCDEKLKLEETLAGIRIIRYRIKSQYGSGLRQLGAYYKFYKACKAFKKNNTCDYLHCHDIDGAIIGCLINKKKNKMIFDMHEYYERGNRLARWAWRKLTISILKKSYAGIYVTTAYLDQKYKAIHSKLYELRNYPDMDMVKPMEKTDSDLFRIGYHGTVRNQIPDFSALFEAVRNMEDVVVEINGGGIDLKALEILANKYRNVHVNGPYDGIKQSSYLYSNTDLLFCAYDPQDPNYQGDTEVIKYYEAIITGTPILVSSGVGMEKKVINNGFGIACNTRDSASIIKAISEIKDNRNKWNEFHENEIKQSINYSWEKAVSILDTIYSFSNKDE